MHTQFIFLAVKRWGTEKGLCILKKLFRAWGSEECYSVMGCDKCMDQTTASPPTETISGPERGNA